MDRNTDKLVNIMLVDDNPADTRLVKEALKDFKTETQLLIYDNGIEALEFLIQNKESNHFLPDIILLDLNLPRKSGLAVLNDIKTDEKLKRLPVIILATSNNKKEISDAYNCHANCFIAKPSDYNDYNGILQAIEYFWLNLVILPD